MLLIDVENILHIIPQADTSIWVGDLTPEVQFWITLYLCNYVTLCEFICGIM